MALEGDELCFPQLLNASCKKPDPPHPEILFVYCLLLFISALTVALNLLVIISISHFRQLHTPTNLILLSLAVSDFFVGLVVMPVEMFQTATCWMLGDIMCSLYYVLPFIMIAASVGNMVLISIDRYVAICDPLHYPTRITMQRMRICICVCWLYSVFSSIFILYDNFRYPGRYNSCSGECLINIAGDVDLALGFAIPITIIFILNIRIFMVAVSQARTMRTRLLVSHTHHCSRMATAWKSEIKAARTLGVVVVVYIICYCPYYCISLSGNQIVVGTSLEILMVFLMYLNSCLNPIIYAFLYPWFRKCVRLTLTLHILQSGSCDANIL